MKGARGAWEGVSHSFRVELLLFVSCAHLKSPPGLLQNYIARFGHGSAKLARQAQSKEKTLQKMMASGLTERVVSDKVRCDRCG